MHVMVASCQTESRIENRYLLKIIHQCSLVSVDVDSSESEFRRKNSSLPDAKVVH